MVVFDVFFIMSIAGPAGFQYKVLSILLVISGSWSILSAATGSQLPDTVDGLLVLVYCVLDRQHLVDCGRVEDGRLSDRSRHNRP